MNIKLKLIKNWENQACIVHFFLEDPSVTQTGAF